MNVQGGLGGDRRKGKEKKRIRQLIYNRNTIIKNLPSLEKRLWEPEARGGGGGGGGGWGGGGYTLHLFFLANWGGGENSKGKQKNGESVKKGRKGKREVWYEVDLKRKGGRGKDCIYSIEEKSRRI